MYKFYMNNDGKILQENASCFKSGKIIKKTTKNVDLREKINPLMISFGE
jgi:hypothetical protein